MNVLPGNSPRAVAVAALLIKSVHWWMARMEAKSTGLVVIRLAVGLDTQPRSQPSIQTDVGQSLVREPFG